MGGTEGADDPESIVLSWSNRLTLRAIGALIVAVAALAFTAAPRASATPVTFPSDPGFDTGTTWTGVSVCGLLCATSATQPATGGNPGGAAVASYATLANILGLANGEVLFTSAPFTWTGDSPASATLHVDRKAALGTLISVNGTATATYALLDVTANRLTTLQALPLTASDAGFVGSDITVPASLLTAGHSYKVVLDGQFGAAVAVAGGATITWDNVKLSATRKAPVLSGIVTGTPSSTGVTIGAVADTAGADGTYRLQYGTTTAYGSNTADTAISGAASPAPISGTLTGLQPSTTYHARLAITTDGGTTYGPDVTFTTAAAATPPPPVTPTVGAVTATPNGARALDLSAMVAPNGLTGAQYRFAYGTTTSYGSTTTATSLPAADGNGWSLATAALAGLQPGTTYHVRAEVYANGTWTPGADQTVTTAAAQAPSIGTPTATSDQTSAQVSAAITPRSSDVSWHVEYGLDTNYGTSTATQAIPAGSSPVQAVADLAALNPGTTYHFRFVATSADGTTYGADQTVATVAAAPPTPAVGQTTASNVAAHAADVSTQADTNGLTGTQYRFAYGTTNAYGSVTATTATPAADGSGYSTLAASLPSLAAGTTYHVRAEVYANGQWYPGPDATLATAAAQAATIGAPTDTATTTTAHIATTIAPGTAAIRWHVEYGATTSYGTSTPDQTLPAGSSPQAVSVDLTGLPDGADVHYRFVATGPDGTTTGADNVLHTVAAAQPVPTVGTTTATADGVHGASLTAHADLNGTSGADYRFEYGTTDSYGSTTTITAVPAADGSGHSTLTATLTGLAGGTTYHVRAEVRANGSWTPGADTTVTTDAAVPATIATPAATTTTTTAHVATTITPGTADVRWHVEYGADTSYGTATPDQTLSAGSSAQAVSVDLTGLPDGADVHFRFVATGADGTTRGADQVLHTQAITPTPGTTTAAAAGAHGAHLSATIDTNGLSGTRYRFAYGTTTSYGATTDIAAVPAGGAVSADLTGLDGDTTYHARVEVYANGQWYDGADATVRTDAAIAPATTAGAPTVTETNGGGADVATSVTPGTAGVQWSVEYGTDISYGTSTTPVALPAGGSPVAILAHLTGLLPGTTYHLRVVVTGADGTTRGQDVTFTTAAAPSTPSTPTPSNTTPGTTATPGTTTTPATTTAPGTTAPATDNGATEAEGTADTSSNGTGASADAAARTAAAPAPATTAPTTTTPVPTKTTNKAGACRAVLLVSRSRGTAVRVPAYVTVGTPLRITPRAGVAATAVVKVDNKVVKVKRVGRTILIAPALVANGRHTIFVGTGRRATRVVVTASACKAVLSVGTRGGRTTANLAIIPGTTSATLELTGVTAAQLNAAKLTFTTASRTTTATRLGITVTRTTGRVAITKLPATVTAIHLTLPHGTKLAPKAVRAVTVH
jgi:hypothetical protein